MNANSTITLLFLGDVIGKPGRRALRQFIEETNAHGEKPDLLIANVENIAHGFGVTESNIQELVDIGVNVFTGGNHTFDRKEIFEFMPRYGNLLRPANYPEGTAGKGFCYVDVNGSKVAVLNLMGRVFMEPLQSPFAVADLLLEEIRKETNIIFVDMHAEATAEKAALALYLDGRVSAVIGTHTHVQTADERILPQGTAYLTDAGCCGPVNSVIGMDKDAVFRRMVDQLPARFEVASGQAMANGAIVKINSATGLALSIERVHFKETIQPAEQEEVKAPK